MSTDSTPPPSPSPSFDPPSLPPEIFLPPPALETPTVPSIEPSPLSAPPSPNDVLAAVPPTSTTPPPPAAAPPFDGVPPASDVVPPEIVISLAFTPPVEPPVLAAPPAPPPAEPAPPPPPTEYPVLFHGRADEFFRIWIVNTLLTLLTFGIFFPWARVRRRRYLRGSTELLGHRFDYRASPLRLLFGHLLVVALFLAYSLFGAVYPWARGGALIIGVLLLPWIVVRSLAFNAHQTVYRGLRFRFAAHLSPAIKVYLLEPVLIGLTLGFYYPAWQRSKRDYVINHHRYGDAYFRFDGRLGPFYSAYVASGALMLGALMIGGGYLAVMAKRHPGVQPDFVEMIPFFVLYGFGFFVCRELIFAQLFNHVWNHTRLDEHRFRARLNTNRWLGLQLGNLGAILLSAGLLYPWATVRANRYAASCLHFIPAGPIDGIQRLGGTAGSATGDMAAEFVGVDFGL